MPLVHENLCGHDDDDVGGEEDIAKTFSADRLVGLVIHPCYSRRRRHPIWTIMLRDSLSPSIVVCWNPTLKQRSIVGHVLQSSTVQRPLSFLFFSSCCLSLSLTLVSLRSLLWPNCRLHTDWQTELILNFLFFFDVSQFNLYTPSHERRSLIKPNVERVRWR